MTKVLVGDAVTGGATVSSPYATRSEVDQSLIVTATGASTPRANRDRFADTVNVKDYGAKGDGSTDDTAAIQAAVNDSAVNGPVVLFPRGRYVVSGRVTLPVGTGITIRGSGAPSIIVGNGAEVFYRETATHTEITEIEALTFTGSAVAYKYVATDNVLPHVPQRYENLIRRCRFLQNAGGYALSFHGSRESKVEDSFFQTNQGIYLDFTVNFEVVHCDFKDTAYGIRAYTGCEGVRMTGGTMLGAGIGLWVGTNVAGLQVIGAMIDFCDQPIYVDATSDVLIQGTYISTRTANPAIIVKTSVGNTSTRVRIIGNVILTHDQTNNRVIRIENADDVQISGNAIRYWYNGIEYDTVTNLVIDRNTIQLLQGATGQYSITAGTDSATNRHRFNIIDKPISSTLAQIFENPGQTTASSIQTGLHVSGGSFYPPTAAGASQNNAIYMGSGAPSNANGGNGDVYFRTDTPGTVNQRVYVKSSGSWVGIL